MVDNKVTLMRTLPRYQHPGQSNTATHVLVTVLSTISSRTTRITRVSEEKLQNQTRAITPF